MRYLENAVTLDLDPGKCNGCGMCVIVCPHAVFAMGNGDGTAARGNMETGPVDGGNARHLAILVDRGACMECGACAINCKPGAIQVRSGVGCASGVIAGILKGTEPTCGCSDESSACC